MLMTSSHLSVFHSFQNKLFILSFQNIGRDDEYWRFHTSKLN